MRAETALLVGLLAVAGACGLGPGPNSDAGRLAELTPKVLGEYPHDPEGFTQGLIWHQGRIYESTGGYGSSSLRRVELESGAIEAQLKLPADLFGEGLERIGEELYQLTWREGILLRHALDTFAPAAEHRYDGEGWGLCFDGVDLVRSDGTATLTFHDAGSFATLRKLEVTLGGRPVPYLNELECVDGEVWANVWQTDSIVAIDPASGAVTARVDASGLRSGLAGRPGVLNGIAYRGDQGTFLLTGKNWPSIFEVIFVERP